MTSLRDGVNRILFRRAVTGIRAMAPARIGVAGVTVLSMVHHRDVDSYLLAVKSYCLHTAVARAIVIADPTLVGEDRAILRDHVPGLEIRDARQYHDGALPRGGTWERLAAISDEVSNGYVTQLDADTVSLSPLYEVDAAADANRAFLLASHGSVDLVSCAEAARRAKPRLPQDTHIQTWSEANLDALPARYSYARACSGFAGFPRGCFDRQELVEVSRRMESVLGARWAEWGTEQVASNVVCASQPAAELLPHPRFCNANYEEVGTSAFLHFIGYTRFRDARYRQAAGAVIAALGAADAGRVTAVRPV